MVQGVRAAATARGETTAEAVPRMDCEGVIASRAVRSSRVRQHDGHRLEAGSPSMVHRMPVMAAGTRNGSNRAAIMRTSGRIHQLKSVAAPGRAPPDAGEASASYQSGPVPQGRMQRPWFPSEEGRNGRRIPSAHRHPSARAGGLDARTPAATAVGRGSGAGPRCALWPSSACTSSRRTR